MGARGLSSSESIMSKAARGSRVGFDRPGHRFRGAVLLLLCMGLLVQTGCTQSPRTWRDTWRGARHYAAGSEALERGDAITALEELREAARLVPHASEVRNHLGLAWWQLGELDQAQLSFERALALDCDNEAARRNLARLDHALERQSAGRVEEGTDGG